MHSGRLSWGLHARSLAVAALIFLPGALAGPAASPSDPGLAGTLRGVETKYNRLKTVRLRFEQIYSQRGRQNQQVLRREEGTLYLRKPGQMRWEYEEPEPKLFLTDGRQLTLYVPAENRATQMAVKEADDLRTPLAFLLGRLRFDKEFESVERSPDIAPLTNGNLVVKAVPKKMADRVEWVVFELSPDFAIRRLIVAEPGGLQTEFRFQEEEANLPLPQQLFQFQPPAGTEIVRQQVERP